jgi:DNA sulfur modification protein DndD
MKIDKITLNNFRQYEGTNIIDLSTTTDKNIILIGGKNGYGKTNFLMSLVWCLYGEDIVKIDENYKKEIQKEGNYSKFLKSSLNWSSAKNEEDKFSVEIELSEIELPETIDIKSGNNYRCIIKRTFEVSSANEETEISIVGIKKVVFKTEDEKKVFINDYLIPIEAAKFVFFDAEKIANWAELSTKDEGSVLNDALGKILGLDVYETLVIDLETYIEGLRKESATSNVKQQISSVENGIKHNTEDIELKESEINEKEILLFNLRQKINEYETFLVKHSNIISHSKSLDELYRNKNDLSLKEKALENKFNELSEIIPFSILAGKLEEVTDHLAKQDEDSNIYEKRIELIEKNNQLIEKLFNNPPFPIDGDISFSKKMFYAEKAKKIIDEVFGQLEETTELDFEHDLNKSDKDLINETFKHIRKQSKDVFEQTIDNFNRVKNEISDIDRLIKKIESEQQDEEIIKYTNNKNDAKRKIEKLIEEKGALQNQVSQLKKSIEADNQRLQILIKKIEVSEQRRKKLDKANQYIKTLITFIDEQKRSKCSILESSTFQEMQKLMHKMQDSSNDNFVAGIKAEPLPDNDGLKITLFDKEGIIRQKESFSQGEKQIYISSLIKAILSLSIQEFPIFIDTPLGRLDDEHIKNILLNYYPNLASQVVLMATNNEIPPSRFKLMQSNVAKTYLLENKNNCTKFKKGYFQSYENSFK